jgi:hypothetical protein
MPMSIEEALGTLIRMANPYTKGGPTTMSFVAAGTTGGTATIDPTQIPVEEDNYAAQWTFKGQTQNIKRALRIHYTYQKTDDAGTVLYNVTENLLVGFAGSNGT